MQYRSRLALASDLSGEPDPIFHWGARAQAELVQRTNGRNN